MKSIVAETATLADAAQRAARVSPTKGAAFDKANGVLLEVRPSTNAPLRIKATDLESTYWQRIGVIETGDERADWRFPSGLLAGILMGLPLDTGSTVSITEKSEDEVVIKCGRKRSKIRLLRGTYPAVKPYDPSGMETVTGFAKRINQVAWSAHPDNPPLSGVHLDGERLIACDRVRLVVVPCEVPIERPITVPGHAIAALSKNLSEVKLRATDRRLEVMPDDDTQLTATIYDAAYPAVLGIMRDNFAGTLDVDRAEFADAISRMLVLVKGERYPRLRVTIGDGVIFLSMQVPEVGLMEDEIECVGGPTVDRVTVEFTPQNVLGALTHALTERVEVRYGVADDPERLAPVEVVGGDFDCYLMPLVAAA